MLSGPERAIRAFQRSGLLCLLATLSAPLFAQEANFGITAPFTASAGVLDSGRLQLSNPANAPAAFGLRVVLYPTLKLGEHWFAYSAIQLRDMPYFYYDAFLPNRGLDVDIVQAYLGYSVQSRKSALVIKAGQLVSAFGAFPLRYDDMNNPLLDQPLGNIQRITLPANQLLCGTADLLHQAYGFVSAQCGGAAGRSAGLTPATLYGLPGVQVEFSSRPVDARFQLTSGSPSNPQGWGSFRRYWQWTAGAGLSIRQGFRVGGSAFTGPYLDPAVRGALPAGTTVRNFDATGVGLDVQWAHGRWSVQGELQHFQYDQPRFVVAPSMTTGYAEAKTVLTPRLYLAGRAGWLSTGFVADAAGITAASFAPLVKTYEAGGGLWLNRRQLLKASYSWLQIAGVPGTRFNAYGFEFVTHINPPSLTFR